MRVSNKRFDQCPASHVAALFFEFFDAAKTSQCLRARFKRFHSSRYILFDLHFQMEPKFIIKIALDFFSAKKRPQGV
jgi:hypothetical protein